MSIKREHNYTINEKLKMLCNLDYIVERNRPQATLRY